MKTNDYPDHSLEQLLDRLEEKPDDKVGVTTLKGRAVSRSANNVHIAISGGIVAVPIKNIGRVSALSRSQPDAVRLEVRNPQDIQPLLRVRAQGGGTGFGSGGSGTFETARNGEVVGTDRHYTVLQGAGTIEYTDTDTTSGQGDADQCDDSEPGPAAIDDEI
jgi:hypothetical protein